MIYFREKDTHYDRVLLRNYDIFLLLGFLDECFLALGDAGNIRFSLFYNSFLEIQ
jgi:hypothetical protein